MTGKGLICAAISLSLVAAPAAYPFGMVVSDPLSYSYYVDQLSSMQSQLEQATKQVETMGGVLDQTKAIDSKLTGNYKRAADLVKRVQSIQSALEKDSGGSMFDELKKWGNVGRAASGAAGAAADDLSSITGNDLYVDTAKVLDYSFGDPRDKSNGANGYNSMDRKYQVQQDALKGVIAKNAALLGGMNDRLDNIKSLAQQADQTTNAKDAADLTNRILLEILAALNDFMAMQAQTNQALSLVFYQGATDKGMQARQQALTQQIQASQFDIEMQQRAGKYSGATTVDDLTNGGFMESK